MKNKRAKKRLMIPVDLADKLVLTTEALRKESSRPLYIDIKQVYVYVYDQNGPLCRLKYLGQKDEWGFAIFKWTTETFSANEPIFPRKASIRKCIETALNAYP